MSDEIDLALRVWAVPKLPRKRRSRSSKRERATKRTSRARSRARFEPKYVLVFDTETLTDASQALTFGCWRFCRVDAEELVVLDEGLVHDDELPILDPDGFEILRSYVAVRRATTDRDRAISLMSRSEFVEKVLYRAGFELRARIVGFNLPYDLSRLSIDWTEGRGLYRGGFSLILWPGAEGSGYKERRHRPRITIKSLDTKGAFISFTKPLTPDEEDLIPDDSDDGDPDDEYAWRGSFVDCSVLGFALSGEGGSLASMCELFEVPGKAAVEGHGRITPEYIDYCRQDVAATQGLYEALIAELRRHPVDLAPEKAYSPASLAKAYLAAMGIEPLLDRLTGFPVDVLGYAMTAFYGGRAECRVRRWPLPVQLMDFTSMYPSVGALMDLHRLQIAARIDVDRECATEVQALIDGITLDACFDPELWPRLVGFALVAPDRDVLPTRALYDGRTFGIGVNPLTSSEPIWYSLADCVADALLTGRGPKVLRAVRLVPAGGRVRRLRTVKVRGEVEIDPSERDPMVVMVEERQRHKRAGTTTEDERLAAALKIVANSGSYGIYSEFNPREHGTGETTPVEVFGRAEPFLDRVPSPEDPGRYCFPPFAACITGAARLMLAMLERCLTDLGGPWAFGDTDSFAPAVTELGGLIACPGGPVRLHGGEATRALSVAETEAIRQRFESLNPYDRPVVPSILKLEATATCLSVSAKRYALYDLDDDGEPHFLEGHPPSEHGLGQLLSPDGSGPRKHWIPIIWRILIRQCHGFETELPAWFDQPTMSKTVVSSIWVARAFETYNAGLPYRKQVKPFNFVMTAAGAKPPAGIPRGDKFRLIAPFVDDPEKWLDLEYVNVHDLDGARYHLTTKDGRPGLARVDTFRDVLATYGSHPEFKSLAPDGTPCGPQSVGLLRRRPVEAGVIRLIGKESNRLEERRSGELTADDLDLRLTIYEDHDKWRRIVLPKLRRIGVAESAKAVGMSERRMRDILKGRVMPHPRHQLALEALAADPALQS